MTPIPFNLGRRTLLMALAALATLSGPLLHVPASAQMATAGDPLASWNDGGAKQAILAFVREALGARTSPSCYAAARCARRSVQAEFARASSAGYRKCSKQRATTASRTTSV
jgi:hypothetical protein